LFQECARRGKHRRRSPWNEAYSASRGERHAEGRRAFSDVNTVVGNEEKTVGHRRRMLA